MSYAFKLDFKASIVTNNKSKYSENNNYLWLKYDRFVYIDPCSGVSDVTHRLSEIGFTPSFD